LYVRPGRSVVDHVPALWNERRSISVLKTSYFGVVASVGTQLKFWNLAIKRKLGKIVKKKFPKQIYLI